MRIACLLFVGMGAMAGAQACELSLSSPHIDYGHLNRTTLKPQGGSWHLNVRQLTLQVQCPQPADMALAYTALAAGTGAFALGAGGRYRLGLSQAMLDDQPVALGQRSVPGQAPSGVGPQQPLLAQRTLVPIKAGVATQGRRFTALVQIKADVDESVLNAPDVTHWQASGLFEIAGTQRELTLNTAFTPAACTPRLGEGGLIDFGRISAQQLSLSDATRFTRSLSLNVSCDSPTRFAFKATDNRAGSQRLVQALARGSQFGLGFGPQRAALGSFIARIGADALGDGKPLSALQGAPGGAGWQVVGQPQGPALHHDGGLVGFADRAGAEVAPTAIKQLDATLAVELYLAPSRELPLSEEMRLDGAATLEIIYL